jgi:hypothetical protein
MPSESASGRRRRRRPCLRDRLTGISAISATGFVDRRPGTRHDLARRPAGTTGNSFVPLLGLGKRFPTFPPFPPVILPPTERVVQAADEARAVALETPMLMKVMPIPCRRRSADIRHNIAQFCQAQSVETRRKGILAYRRGGRILFRTPWVVVKVHALPTRTIPPLRGFREGEGARVAGGGVMISTMKCMTPPFRRPPPQLRWGGNDH